MGSRSFAAESVPPAARGGIPAKFCLRGRGRGSRLQCAGLSRGTAHEGWKNAAVSRRDRAAGGEFGNPRFAHADRRIIRTESRRQEISATWEDSCANGRADEISAGNRAGGFCRGLAEGGGTTLDRSEPGARIRASETDEDWQIPR